MAGRPGLGVDIVELPRIEQALARFGDRFLQRVYTPAEQAYCRRRIPQLAGRFAVKEAVSKALGTGIRRLHWRNIEVLPDVRGAPKVTLYGHALQRLAQAGFSAIEVSISHSRDNAVAMAVAVQAAE
ncbi:MAG: holo-ACP synthase [Chloroflexota bacterium]